MVPVGPNALRHGEALLTLLRAGDLSLTQAAYAGDALSLYTKAFAYEGSIWSSSAVDRTEIVARGKQMVEYMNSLPAEAFANMLQTDELFTAETSAERFEFGLNMLLHGLTALTRPE